MNLTCPFCRALPLPSSLRSFFELSCFVAFLAQKINIEQGRHCICFSNQGLFDFSLVLLWAPIHPIGIPLVPSAFMVCFPGPPPPHFSRCLWLPDGLHSSHSPSRVPMFCPSAFCILGRSSSPLPPPSPRGSRFSSARLFDLQALAVFCAGLGLAQSGSAPWPRPTDGLVGMVGGFVWWLGYGVGSKV